MEREDAASFHSTWHFTNSFHFASPYPFPHPAMAAIPKHRQLPDKESKLFRELLVRATTMLQHPLHAEMIPATDPVRAEAVQKRIKSRRHHLEKVPQPWRDTRNQGSHTALVPSRPSNRFFRAQARGSRGYGPSRREKGHYQPYHLACPWYPRKESQRLGRSIKGVCNGS